MSYSISYIGLDAKQAKYRSVSSVLLVLGLCGLLVEGSVLPAAIASIVAPAMLLFVIVNHVLFGKSLSYIELSAFLGRKRVKA
jgi:hypothetical protein